MPSLVGSALPRGRRGTRPRLTLFCRGRQHDGGVGGQGRSAGELDRRERPHRSRRWRNLLLRLGPECRQSHIQPTGRDEDVHVHAGHPHQAAQVRFPCPRSYRRGVKRPSLTSQFTDWGLLQAAAHLRCPGGGQGPGRRCRTHHCL